MAFDVQDAHRLSVRQKDPIVVCDNGLNHFIDGLVQAQHLLTPRRSQVPRPQGQVIRPREDPAVRELAGTMRVADSGNERASKGLILTTSTFTQGARELAATLQIDLMDGVALREELRSEPATGVSNPP